MPNLQYSKITLEFRQPNNHLLKIKMNLKLINELNHIIGELKARDGSLERARELLKNDIIEYWEKGSIDDDGQIDLDIICKIVDRRFNELDT